MLGEVVCGREAGEAAAYHGDFLVGFAGGVGAGEERCDGVMFLEDGGGDMAGGSGAYPRCRVFEEHGGSWNCDWSAESSHGTRSMDHGVVVRW